MANRFTPPTYEQAFLPEDEQRPDVGIMRRISFPVGYSVLITNGSATPYPGKTSPTGDEILAADPGSGAAGRAAFLGGGVYIVTDAEKTILEAAGYTVTTT